MPTFTRATAIEYLIAFVAFWALDVAAIITDSNRLACGPTGCDDPTYPVLFVAGLAVGVGLVTIAFRLTKAAPDRWRPNPRLPFDPIERARSPLQLLWFDAPPARFVWWWSFTASLLEFGLAVPSAARAVR